MSWHLKGSYAETCSCDLMCPCNFSFDHGATYDYCRAALAFNIKAGEIDGTDVSGLKVAVVIDTPKVMTDGQLAARRLHRRPGDRRADGEARRRLHRADGRPDGGARARWSARCSASSACRSRSIDDGLLHSVKVGDAIDFEIEDIVPFGVETGEPVRFDRHVPPGRLDADDRRGDALEDQRVRHRVRREDGPLDGRVLLGGVSRDARAQRAVARAGSRRVRGRAGAARARRAPVRARRRRVVVDGRPRCRGWTAARGRASGRSAGSSASGW